MSSGSEDSQEEDGLHLLLRKMQADLSAEQSTGRWHEIMIEIDEIQTRMPLMSASAKEHLWIIAILIRVPARGLCLNLCRNHRDPRKCRNLH